MSEIVEMLDRARTRHEPIAQITLAHPGLTVEDAYDIQLAGVELEKQRGGVACGFKMGLTSRAKQKDVGVFEPIRGVLFRKTRIDSGAKLLRQDFIHPRVEPEIAMILRNTLSGTDVTCEDVVRALEFAGPALEIVDSRYKNFKFNLADVVADNTSAAAFMIGRTNYLDVLEPSRLYGCLVSKNGEVVETGCPAAALGDPLVVMRDFIHTLSREGRALEKGQIVLTGGLTASVPFDAGDSLEVIWPGETLSFSVV